MRTFLVLVLGLALLGAVWLALPHRAAAQASEYAALFAQCRASGGDPGSSVFDWNQTGCKCGGVATGRGTCEQPSGSTSSSGGGSSDLATESAKAMAKGIMNGNSQEFGMGVAGMMLNGLLENSSDGGDDAEEAARQAAEQRRQEALRLKAEQNQMRGQDEARARIQGVLKDSDSASLEAVPVPADPKPSGAGPVVGGIALKHDDDVGDTKVVDARNVPSGLPRGMDDAIAGACAATPEGVCDRVRKGFQAVMTRDWNVAKAWFQDAASRDPNNAWLKDLVAHSAATTAKPPVLTGPLPSDADLDRQFDILYQQGEQERAQAAALDRQFDTIYQQGEMDRTREQAALDREFDVLYQRGEMDLKREQALLDREFDLIYNAGPSPAPQAAAPQPDNSAMRRTFDLNYDPPAIPAAPAMSAPAAASSTDPNNDLTRRALDLNSDPAAPPAAPAKPPASR